VEQVRAAFAARYGRPPAVVAVAPGRVNLIGEHTDYSGLPVLPIAIERRLLVACAPNDAAAVVHVASERFDPPAEVVRGIANAPVHAPWHRYVSGVVAQVEGVSDGVGADVLVGGDLPAASGLSSSAALSVGLLAALGAAWGEPLDRETLVARAIVADRASGAETGGMDQAATVFAQAGHALRIDFEPPARRSVAIPPGLAFVVANSGAEAPKGGAAREAYNERVVGARIAAAMLADQIGVDLTNPPRLGEIAGVDVVDILVDELPEKISPVEVSRTGAAGLEQLVQLTATRFDHMRKVPVRKLARHILSEAVRVDEAEAALAAGDLARFGKLLDASHESLRADFGCSTPELDALCKAMRGAGALGARLTGAGFGGYALAAVPPEQVESVIAAAIASTGGPAFEVHASDGLEVV